MVSTLNLPISAWTTNLTNIQIIKVQCILHNSFVLASPPFTYLTQTLSLLSRDTSVLVSNIKQRHPDALISFTNSDCKLKQWLCTALIAEQFVWKCMANCTSLATVWAVAMFGKTNGVGTLLLSTYGHNCIN